MFIVIENRRPIMHGETVMTHQSIASAMDHVSDMMNGGVSWTTYGNGKVIATGVYHRYEPYDDKFVTRTFAIYQIGGK